MFLDKNKEIDILKNIFKNNSSIDSIFIDSWDSIYLYDKNKNKYVKSDYSFHNFIQYRMFVDCITDKNKEDKDIQSNYYLKLELDVEAYIHLWNSDDFWTVLKRVPIENIT